MRISKKQTGDLITVTLTGNVDLETSPSARDVFLEILEKKNALHVNCSEIKAIDSSGIAILIEAFQNSQQQKLDFKLIAVKENVMRVLQLARLDSVFPIAD